MSGRGNQGGRGNTRDYEFERGDCPKCGRSTVYSRNPRAPREVRFRRHKPCAVVHALAHWVGHGRKWEQKFEMEYRLP